MRTERMEAGRELDALVAERVMGWELRPFSLGHWYYAGSERTAPANWSPSTDIAAAWEVVQAMEDRQWWFRLETYPNPYGINDGATTVATFKPTGMPGQPLDDVSAAAWDAPLAICAAALASAHPEAPTLERAATGAAAREEE